VASLLKGTVTSGECTSTVYEYLNVLFIGLLVKSYCLSGSTSMMRAAAVLY